MQYSANFKKCIQNYLIHACLMNKVYFIFYPGPIPPNPSKFQEWFAWDKAKMIIVF